MAQLLDNCFAFGEDLVKSSEALDILSDRLDVVVGKSNIGLRSCLGRVLAADIKSRMPVPPHDNSAVDGYAVRFEDLASNTDTRLKVVGRVIAGDAGSHTLAAGQAVRIFTGAPMPANSDTELMQEDCQEQKDEVIVPAGIKEGANRRSAGEDIAAGEIVLTSGTRLRPQEIGLAASIGRTELPIFNRLRVALFSTGNEVRDIGNPLTPGCIYDTNRYSIVAALEDLDCEVSDLGILPDNYQVICDTLAATAGQHDLIMTSGGISIGEEDHVRNVINTLGHLHFWRLAIRPGRPLALGQIGSVPFIGLPGNPVAVLVTFMRFARPAILRLGGCTNTEPKCFRVRAGFSAHKKLGRREWLRARVGYAEDGEPVVHKFPRDGAGILSSMVASDGLVELPEDLTSLEAGTMVDYLPFNEMR